MAEETETESWNRFPKTKFRMRAEGLKQLLEGLSKGGFCRAGNSRISLVEDGVYIELCSNVGQYGDIQALAIEVFIPVDPADMPKEKPDDNKDDIETGPTTDVRAVSPETDDIKMADDGVLSGDPGPIDGTSDPVAEGPGIDPTGNTVDGIELQPSV